MILYKLNNFNDISWWQILQDDTTCYISWGSSLPAIESKNVQTCLLKEYQSRIDHQIDRKGYTEEIPTHQPSLPMLAQVYEARKHKFSEYALQPKLDGIRCIMSKDGLLSRKNSQITSCPHMEMYLPSIPEGIKLDGELYIKNTPYSTIESYVMRSTPNLAVSKLIEYHIYDIIDLEAPFSARIDEVQRIVRVLEDSFIRFLTTDHPFKKLPYFSHNCPFKVVYTEMYNTPQEKMDGNVSEFFNRMKEQKYEGAMIREMNSPYEPNKRSKSLLKVKSFLDSEFKIIDIVETDKGNSAVLVLITSGGMEFNCSFKSTNEQRRKMLRYKESRIGKMCRVEYEGLHDTGIPRCPVGIHIYDN